MENVLHIKCPKCGAVLAIKPQPGLENASITCPVCKVKSRFADYKQPSAHPSPAAAEDSETQYPKFKQGAQQEETETQIFTPQNYVLGSLYLGNQRLAVLKPGRNVIGRLCSTHDATVEIPTDDRRMSRQHLVVEATKVPGKGYVHQVSLFKSNINETFVGNTKLEYGDCLILKSGDLIKLPGATLRFMIEDGDETTY